MRWLAQFGFRLRSLFSKRKLDEQLSEEIRTHVEMATEANIAAGMAPDEARYAALREFGNVVGVQERARDEQGWVWLEQFWQDLRYGCRQLARTPGFTGVIVVTLALGIGGTAAVFSMVNTVILNPVGGPEPERMVEIGQRAKIRSNIYFQGVSPPVLDGLLGSSDAFAGLSWGITTALDRNAGEFIRNESGAYVSGNFFTTLQRQPLLGRTFLPGESALVVDGVPDRDAAIVLSYDWWQAEWGGDRNVLGTRVELSGRQFTVIGVMPGSFRFPSPATKFWLPVSRIVLPTDAVDGPNTKVYARLKAGAATGLQARLDALAKRLKATHASNGYGELWSLNQLGLALSFRPFSETLQEGSKWGQLRNTLWSLFAAIGFLLLIMCANVASLALARVEQRQQEFAIRAALGAGSGRLGRQLLTENMLLALLGGSLGLIVAIAGVKMLAGLNVLPSLRPAEIDLPLLGFLLAVSVVVGICFGLVPVWQGAKVRVPAALADGGNHTTGGRPRTRFRNLLVVGQIALAFLLLSGAGLMLASVHRILRVDPGYDPHNLLVAKVRFPGPRYEAPNVFEAVKRRNLVLQQLQERFRALPGVAEVGLQITGFSMPFKLEGRAESIPGQVMNAGVGPNNPFAAMRVPLMAGRQFTAEDAGRKGVVMVNETLASRFWPGENAVGKKLRSDTNRPAAYEVIGVVRDARVTGYATSPLPLIYLPYHASWRDAQVAGNSVEFVIRTEIDPGMLVSLLRRELKAVNMDFREPSFAIQQQVLFESTSAQRTYRNYLGLFAALGLLISALGIYGVLAFSVTRRSREIGIRMAVGAEASQVRTMVLRQGGRLILAGTVVGLVAATGLTRLLQSQLFEVDPLDPLALMSAVGVLTAVGLLACWLPARRAARIDPVVALRSE